MTRSDLRIDDDFELAVAEGRAFRTLYVRVEGEEPPPEVEVPADALRRLAVEGAVDAQIGWARRLLHGHGVAADPEAALRWFKIAARTGDAEALNMVGRCYELGWGVPVDCREAADWFRRAAEKGNSWGAFNLALLYAEGRGVLADERQAVTLLVRAARSANPKAMTWLGAHREATARPRSAAFWFRLAAQGGCFRGQFHHGRLLAADGRIAEAVPFFRAALAEAPPVFRQQALDALRAAAHPDLRALAADADAPR